MADLINNLGGPAGFGTQFLAPNDDGSTEAVDITPAFANGLNLFGSVYGSVYINNNENVTFGGQLGDYTPTSISGHSGEPIIAPFWADVDTRQPNSGSGSGGEEIAARSASAISSAGSDLVWYDVNAATKTVTITWDDVGYYSKHTDKVDAFQLQLVAEPDGSARIRFLYNSIQWVTGDASGGQGGLGGTPARIGYSANDGKHYLEIPQSGDQSALLNLPSTIGNTGLAGIFEFQTNGSDLVTPLSAWLAEDTGASATDHVTRNATIDGSGTAGATVTISEGDSFIGETSVDQSGHWTFDASRLGDGAHDLSITQSLGDGPTDTTDLAFTLDRIGPALAFTTADGTVTQAAQTLRGTSDLPAGQTVAIFAAGITDPVATATVGADGSWSAAVTLPGAGRTVFVARATDLAGNSTTSSPLALTLSAAVDPSTNAVQGAPLTITSPGGLSSTADQLITGTADRADAGRVVAILDASGTVLSQANVAADGTWSAPTTLPGQGTNVLTAQLQAPDGHILTSNAITFTLDSEPPVVTITTPALQANSATQTLSGTVGNEPNLADLTVVLTDGGAVFATARTDAQGHWSVDTPLPVLDQHRIVATVTDPFGNQGSSAALTGGPIQSQPSTQTTDGEPVVRFTTGVRFLSPSRAVFRGTIAAGATITSLELFDNGQSLGTATIAGDGTWRLDTRLATGQHETITAIATDTNGATTQVSAPFRLETGIRGQPYVSLEQDFDPSGTLVGETYTRALGRVYLQSTVTPEPNGGQAYTYMGGSYFEGQDFYAYRISVAADGSTLSETTYNNDGTHTTTGFADDVRLQGLGDDTMTGGGTHQTFVFGAQPGAAVITDFHPTGPGHDVIVLAPGSVANIAALLGGADQVGADTVLNLRSGDTITLQNVALTNLIRKDFSFHA